MPRGRKNKSLDERIQDTQQSIYNLEVRKIGRAHV